MKKILSKRLRLITQLRKYIEAEVEYQITSHLCIYHGLEDLVEERKVRDRAYDELEEVLRFYERIS